MDEFIAWVLVRDVNSTYSKKKSLSTPRNPEMIQPVISPTLMQNNLTRWLPHSAITTWWYQ
jgi:hypothetical protein